MAVAPDLLLQSAPEVKPRKNAARPPADAPTATTWRSGAPGGGYHTLLELAGVAPGALIEILDASGDKVRVRPVHPEEATIDDERISWDSPLGRAIMGAAVGDKVEVPSPRGSWTCEVLRIAR